jgi:uncharacterized protein (TIGR02687 family)
VERSFHCLSWEGRLSTEYAQVRSDVLAVHEATLFGKSNVDTPQLQEGLQKLFDQYRIVFWHDADREFFEAVDQLTLSGPKIIRMAQSPNEGETSSLAVKLRIELEEPESRFLIYCPFETPPLADDFLLDVRLYGGTFRADRASMLLHELGLGERQALRSHLNARLKFFNSKDRMARLRKLIGGAETETSLDRKMIAILVRAEQPEPFSILQALFHDMSSRGGIDDEPSEWVDMIKYGLVEPFWEMVADQFGFTDEVPKLRNFLIRLFVTDFVRSLSGVPPTALSVHVLPNLSNTSVFLGAWRDSLARGSSYAVIANQVEMAASVGSLLSALSADALQDVQTFPIVEQRVASELRERVAHRPTNGEASSVRAIVAKRLDGHWANPALGVPNTSQRFAFAAVYRGLLSAMDLFLAVEALAATPPPTDSAALVRSYRQTYAKIDTLYRWVCEAADTARDAGWDILKDMREPVENAYANGYLMPLTLAWGKALESGLLDTWSIPGIPHQKTFFERGVASALEGDTKRVFVIVSDGFRYEAAAELAEELRRHYRFVVDLSTQLSALPSITALGMAALLPHKKLTVTDQGEVLADGASTSGTTNRSKILDAVCGVAVGASELLKMKKDEGRAFVRDRRVVYVYHNTIDAVGDSQGTEGETFVAVRDAINEIAALTRHIVNSLNGSLVLITADHGFLYLDAPPTEAEKSEPPLKLPQTIRAKKRYVLGRDLPQPKNAWYGNTDITCNTDSDTKFIIPRGTNRFHFAGGARYFHGGAMPQEVLVPVITVRENEADKQKLQAVAVHLLVPNTKVTTSRYRIQAIQTEPLGERRTPLVVKIAIYDGGAEVSSVQTVTFDSASDSMEERTKTAFLSLKSLDFDRNRPYQLVMSRLEDSVELQRHELTIDLAFHNDF